jgi:hypothetical protein
VSDYQRVKDFVDGAKTGIDWLNHRGELRESKPSEYEDGFRSALDAIGNYFDEIDEGRAPKAFGAVVDG